MQLKLQNQWIDDVVVIRCQGRIVLGEEVGALQQELEKQTVLTKKVVLQLGEVSFLDSVGLGALVRQFSGLRSKGGDLKLCQISPLILQILQVTNLLRILPIYESEADAIQAFSKGQTFHEETLVDSKKKIVCIDPSHDVLAYVSALLKRSGYEVITTRNPTDAQLFVRVAKPQVMICGPGMHANESAMKTLGELSSRLQLLILPADFSTAEAGQAGTDLVNRVRSILPD